MTQKQIRKIRSAKWRKAHPIRFRRSLRKWKLKNLWVKQFYDSLYQYAFPEKAATRNKTWRTVHPRKIRKIRQTWKNNNRDRVRETDARYRAKLRANTIGDLNLIAKIYTRAQELRKWFDVVVDHIIPISKGGAHSPENLQIIYAFENSIKGNSLSYRPKVIFK